MADRNNDCRCQFCCGVAVAGDYLFWSEVISYQKSTVDTNMVNL